MSVFNPDNFMFWVWFLGRFCFCRVFTVTITCLCDVIGLAVMTESCLSTHVYWTITQRKEGRITRLACSEFFGPPEFAFTDSNTPCAPNLKLAICTGVMLHQERAWTLSWPWGLFYTLRLGCYVHVRGNGFTRDSKLKC